MRTITVCVLFALVSVTSLLGQPAIGVFPIGSNGVHFHHLARMKNGNVRAVLIENVPGGGQVVRSSQNYTITNATATGVDTEIRAIGQATAERATTYPVSNRNNTFDIRIGAQNTNSLPLLNIAASFNIVNNATTGSWTLPPDNTPESLPLYLSRPGTESYAPDILMFDDYPDMTEFAIRFKNASGVVIREGNVLKNSLRVFTWYASAYGYDAAYSIKGQKDAFDNPEMESKICIPLSTLTNGYFGEIIITRTNANGAFVERYILENGSRIVAPTSLQLAVTNSMPTLQIVSEPTSRVQVQYSTNQTLPRVWNTATNMIISANGTIAYPCTSSSVDSLRLYRLVHW
ncbi:MAG: hypothetical protein AAB447_02510 [Patescibacteria group bacterium]